MGSRCSQIASVVLMLGAAGLYIAAFAGTGWLSGDKYDYGLWRMCETNSTGSERCEQLDLSSQDEYFEASRTLATFALVLCVVSLVTCFLEENDTDTGLRKTCYRYFFCVSALLTVALQISTLAVMGGNYQDDPDFKGMGLEPGWCVTLTGVATGLTFLSCLCRFKFITTQHNVDRCCCSDCPDHAGAKTGPGLSIPDLSLSADSAAAGAASLRNGRCQMPASAMRRTLSATSSGLDGRITHLPPLPLNARGGGALPRTSSLRSADSGLDVSRDSILDEVTGPLPLSVEMLKRHDRRFNAAMGRRMDDRRRRPAFSSTTSLSTTDSQSSAELAPRVHTPTNMKRVHYNDVLKEHAARPEDASPGPPDVGVPPLQLSATGPLAAPIISLPIKTQGVELSRAATNATTSSTIDNLRSVSSSALRKGKGAAAEPIAEESGGTAGEEDGAPGESGTRPSSVKKEKKEKKKKSSKKNKSRKSSKKDKNRVEQA